MGRTDELVQKRALLAQYYIAEQQILEGAQSYSIGNRTLERGDLKTIQAERRLLEKEVRKLALGGGIRVQRIVPRNL